MKKSNGLMKRITEVTMGRFPEGYKFDLDNLKWFLILRILSEVENEFLFSSGKSKVKPFSTLEILEYFLQYGIIGYKSEVASTKINEFLDLMRITEIPEFAEVMWLYSNYCGQFDFIKKSLSEIESNSCIGDDRIGIYYKSNTPSRCVSDLVIKIIPDKELLTVGRSVFDIKRMFIASEYCDKISFGKAIIDNNQIIDCYIKADLGSYDNDQYVLLEKKRGILCWRKLDVISAPW